LLSCRKNCESFEPPRGAFYFESNRMNRDEEALMISGKP
jgi:hypothetical protein